MSEVPGRTVLRAGPGAEAVFRDEAGGHRWQRVPPTEKKGRVHTSTVTVAVFAGEDRTVDGLDESDLEEQTCRGSGKGGQNRNKRDTAVQLTHRPTGLTVRAENERSQHRNRQVAREMLAAKLAEQRAGAAKGAEDAARRAQVGSGQRGDKRRTVRAQDGQVVDHPTGRRWRYEDYVRGRWD